MRDDPGLLFSRIQYARRAGRVYEAAVILSLAPHDRAALVNPDRWWSERKMIARALLDLDEPRLAFEVCDQTVRPDSLRGSGRRCLPRRLDRLALPRRRRLGGEALCARGRGRRRIRYPVARAAYWQGRAAEAWAMPRRPRASTRARPARRSPITASSPRNALARPVSPSARPLPAAEGERRDEAVRAAEALYADGLDDLAAALAFDAARQWRDESQIAAMAEVVKQHGDAGTQVQFAKIAVMQGHPFDAMAFPAVGMPAFLPLPRSADLPTVYAVARQESEFIWHANSGAGAKGLMQMLPRPRP